MVLSIFVVAVAVAVVGDVMLMSLVFFSSSIYRSSDPRQRCAFRFDGCDMPFFIVFICVLQNSKMHELEMDQNNVVFHTRRCSTAVGVTPSDPSAIVDLFQEVEYIGE